MNMSISHLADKVAEPVEVTPVIEKKETLTCGECGSDDIKTDCFDGDNFENECVWTCRECGAEV